MDADSEPQLSSDPTLTQTPFSLIRGNFPVIEQAKLRTCKGRIQFSQRYQKCTEGGATTGIRVRCGEDVFQRSSLCRARGKIGSLSRVV